MRAPPSDLPIVFDKVVCRAGSVTILGGVSLQILAGPPTVLVGPNGGGKSTLMRAAMGLIEPTEGRVTFGGRLGVPPARRAIVFQRPAMLRRSAAGNIAYALASAGVPRAERAGRVAGLLETVRLSGLGDRPARRLSGGEQQRLALARALARDPEVLFLDEPTASLDPSATKAIEEVIAAIAARGIKVVMSTHDLGEARRLAGEVVLVHRGRALECTPADRFFSAPSTDEARRFIAGDLLV